MALSDQWIQEAENWIRWARTPGHDSYWRFHRDQFLELLPAPGKLTVDIGCDYRCASATKLPFSDKSSDLAVAFMSLHDIDDLTTGVAEIGRVLVDGGVAVIAIVHPLNSAGSDNLSSESPFVIENTYLGEFDYASEESRDGLRMTFHSRHRPIDTYSRALEAAGFVIEAIREHPVPDDVARAERHRRWQRIPLFLHLRARKLPAVSYRLRRRLQQTISRVSRQRR